MAINGLGTQPVPHSLEYGAQTSSNMSRSDSAQNQKPPGDSTVILELSDAGRKEVTKQRRDAAYLAPGYNMRQDNAHNLLKRTTSRVSQETGQCNGIQVIGNHTGYNPKVQERYFAEASKLPESLTEEDLKYLTEYRRDQYEAALLKSSKDQANIQGLLASKSEGVRKAYVEIPEALTEQDLDYLIQYRREQLNAAVTRKNELAQQRYLQEATEIPEALTPDDLKYLVQYRQDQYKAAFMKANENQINITEALASSTEGVRKAYTELNDALTKEDLDFLLDYRQAQYNAVKQREAGMMSESLTGLSGQPIADQMQKLLKAYAKQSGN